jgi:hypothetical protein
MPNFAAWDRQLLDKFAGEAYLRLQAQEDALEQLRGDLKDAMKLLRRPLDLLNAPERS